MERFLAFRNDGQGASLLGRSSIVATNLAMSCTEIDPALHQARKPDWIRVRLPSNRVFFSTKALVSDLKLHTVCEEAQCPNRWQCWSQGTATFMIAGDRCTRACGFFAVTTAKLFPLEDDEPQRVAEAVRRMRLKHVVVTAVARDSLQDGGAAHFARTNRAIREAGPEIKIEVLTPDFHAKDACLETVVEAGPQIFSYNLETVERLTPLVHSRAKDRRSLEMLGQTPHLFVGDQKRPATQLFFCKFNRGWRGRSGG